ncbi:MAG: AAA family ATPase, partial [Burkholderiales bacterium]|nr:AAA family ATPase [Burkholderiales bacterium]
KTPSGAGFHLFFGLMAEGAFNNRGLGSGIDVRCSAGYVGVEPTRIRLDDGSEKAYAFDDWDVTAGEVPAIAQAPAWLLELLSAGAPAAQALHGAEPAAASPRETVTPQQVAELRSALNILDADDRATWIENGMRLKGLGNAGRELWLTWSQQSSKFDPGDAARTWSTLKPEHSGYQAVFAAAQAAGWVNPSSRAGALPGGAPGAAAGTPQEPPGPAFRVVPIADLDTAEVPPQAWFWDGYIPARALTLFGAHGGTGKSTVALMLAACTALGLPLFGADTRPSRVLFFSAEDDADTVRRRLQRVCRHLGVSAALLANRLHVLDATEGEPMLFDECWTTYENGEAVVKGPTTKTHEALARFIQDAGVELLIVDNASDTYGGNEIARKEVREFVRSLVALVRKQRGAVCLLAHIDKSAAKGFGGAESYSGSTAWHNSARSRLTLKRDKDGGGLVLEHEKCNYGPTRDPMPLVWPGDGLPQVDAPASAIVQSIATDNATRAILRLVHEFTARGEFVSTATTSRTHAGRLLRDQPTFPRRLTDAEVFDLLRRAERREWVQRMAYRGADRKPRERWELTSAGAGVAEIPDFAATAATAATAVVPADGANPAEPAATAATSPPGGVGERARTQVAADFGAWGAA